MMSFIPRTIVNWNELPTEEVQAPTLGTYKSRLAGLPVLQSNSHVFLSAAHQHSTHYSSRQHLGKEDVCSISCVTKILCLDTAFTRRGEVIVTTCLYCLPHTMFLIRCQRCMRAFVLVNARQLCYLESCVCEE